MVKRGETAERTHSFLQCTKIIFRRSLYLV